VIGEILGPLGLHLAMNGPGGGAFIYSEPGYTALVDAVAPGGGGVIGVPLDQHLQNDLSAIAAKVSPRTRVIYLVDPHNPSGTVNDTETFTAFVRDMSRRITVIVDEAYLEFEPDSTARTAILASARRTHHRAARQPVTKQKTQLASERDSYWNAEPPPAAHDKRVEKGAIDAEHYSRRAHR
jgi:aspartate/methionine/tyrosine aminotransferase